MHFSSAIIKLQDIPTFLSGRRICVRGNFFPCRARQRLIGSMQAQLPGRFISITPKTRTCFISKKKCAVGTSPCEVQSSLPRNGRNLQSGVPPIYFSDEKGSRWSPDRLVKFRLSAICCDMACFAISGRRIRIAETTAVWL